MRESTSVEHCPDSPQATPQVGLAVALLLMPLVGACGDDASSGGEDNTGNSGMTQTTNGGNGAMTNGGEGGSSNMGTEPLTYSPCSVETKVGDFTFDVQDTFTGFNGAVRDGVVPTDVPEEVTSEGTCRLYSPRNLFCDPPCGSSETCGFDGACIPFPVGHSVGTISVAGLKEPLEMEPNPNTKSYTNMGSLPHPAFDPGDAITLTTTGGDFDPITLRGAGITPLEAPDEEFTVAEGEPVALSWTAPASSGPTSMRILLNINNHGGPPSKIECDAPDTGSFDIPATLVDTLFTLGVSGWPTVRLERRTADSAQIAPGCVELLVNSALELSVQIPGLVSCDTDEECPAGACVNRACE